MKTLLLLFLLLPSLSHPSCRSPSIKHSFDLSQGYKHSRPGYIVDHICALECGGLDRLNNMQYQSILDSKKKDKWERSKEGCLKTCNPSNSLPTRTVYNCKE